LGQGHHPFLERLAADLAQPIAQDVFPRYEQALRRPVLLHTDQVQAGVILVYLEIEAVIHLAVTEFDVVGLYRLIGFLVVRAQVGLETKQTDFGEIEAVFPARAVSDPSGISSGECIADVPDNQQH